MSLEKLIEEIATSHPVATRAQRVTGITHRVGEAKQIGEAAADSAANANAEASRANTAVLEAAATAQQAGEDARQAGADVLDTIRRIEDGSLKTYLNLTDYVNEGKLAGQITGVYIADLAVSRAKIADAAINSAKIANLAVNSQHVNELTASKITSGDITASLISVTGRLEAGGGGVRLDANGLALDPLANTGSAPADSSGRKVTNLGSAKWAALFAFNGGGVRGMAIRSDGSAGSTNGRVELVATAAGDSSASSTGRVRVDAGGAVLLEGNTTLQGSLGVTGNISTANNAVYGRGIYSTGVIGPNSVNASYIRQVYVTPITLGPNGGWTAVNHGMGQAPDFIYMQVNAGGGWGPVGTGGYGIDINADATSVRFTNNSSVSRSMRATINNGA